MLGLVVRGKFMGRTKILQYSGVKFLAVPVCAGKGILAKVTAHRAARYFARVGISRVAFPKGYSFLDLFAARGILSPDIAALQQAAAAQIARAELAAGNIRRVVFAGERPTGELVAAAEELCQHVRYLSAHLLEHGAALQQHLRCIYGVALEASPPERWTDSDLVLLFSRIDGWEKAQGNKIPLYDAALAEQYLWFPAVGPGEFEPVQMLAVLFAAGALERKAICVRKHVSGEKREKLTEP